MLAEDWLVASLLALAIDADSDFTGRELRLRVFLLAGSEHRLAEWSCLLIASSSLGTSGCMSS